MPLKFTTALLAFTLLATEALPQSSAHFEKAEVDACQSTDTTKQSCFWHMRVDTKQCRLDAPCSKLVIVLSSSGLGCDDPGLANDRGLGRALARYAADGYVAVCGGVYGRPAQTLPPVPFHKQADRVDALVMAITGSPAVRRYWDGRHLLYSGFGEGATALIASLASTDHAKRQGRRGSRATAACLLDTSVDPYATDAFWTEAPQLCRRLHERSTCQRYSLEASCPRLTRTPLADADNLASLEVESLGLSDWKLIACGQHGPKTPCGVSGPWYPLAPQRKLCTHIASSANHRCEWEPIVEAGYANCPTHPKAVNACRLWFNALTLP